MDQANAMPLDRDGFREVVRHPTAHALVLGNYRLGEYAGVVALDRLLGEMRPEGKLHQAMSIHHRDEGRHSRHETTDRLPEAAGSHRLPAHRSVVCRGL